MRRLLLLAALLLLLGLGWKVARVLLAAQEVEQQLAELSARAGDPVGRAAIPASLPGLARSLRTLEVELRPLAPLLRTMEGLLGEAAWMADAPDALGVAAPLAEIGAAVAASLADGATTRSGPLATVERLAPQTPQLLARVDEAESALARLQGRPLRGPLAPAQPWVERVPEALPPLRHGLRLLEGAGPALGAESPRTYLLLGQNSAEIRATGGFIGSVGWVTLDRGEVVQLEYGSGYLVDQQVVPPPPPAPLARYLGLGGWYLRDANWWPDFPASAAQVEQAWQRAGRPPLDGVIAFDTATLEALLRALGPLLVPGYGTVTAESFERQAAEQLYQSEAITRAGGFHQAKGAFLAPIGRALTERLLRTSPTELVAIGMELARLLDEKHVQVVAKDLTLRRVLRGAGWDGALATVDGESLLVVDTTVSYGDTYRFVRSDVRHQVQVSADGRRRHQLELTYWNRYPLDLPPWMPIAMVEGASYDPASGRVVERPGFWGNWLRVYLPAQAAEIQTEGFASPVLPQPELGRVRVGGYLPMAPGERRTVRIQFATPPGGDAYRLYLEKQAGLQCRPYTLTVEWPRGARAEYGGCPTLEGWIELSAPSETP